MAIIPSGLEIFPSQNTKYSKNDMKLQYTEKTVSLIYGHRKNLFELKKAFLIQKKLL